MRTFDWDAPAKLFFWPGEDGWDEDAAYPSLHQALAAAGEGSPETAWIITLNGDIISPRLIVQLREEMDRRPGRHAPGFRSFFGWARAA